MRIATLLLLAAAALTTLASIAWADEKDKSLLGPGGTYKGGQPADVAQASANPNAIATCRSSCGMQETLRSAITLLCQNRGDLRACFERVCQARCN